MSPGWRGARGRAVEQASSPPPAAPVRGRVRWIAPVGSRQPASRRRRTPPGTTLARPGSSGAGQQVAEAQLGQVAVGEGDGVELVALVRRVLLDEAVRGADLDGGAHDV